MPRLDDTIYVSQKSSTFSMKDYIVPIMVPDEKVFSEYTSSYCTIVFTNKRLIVIKPEGFSKSKKSIFNFPYSNIQSFSFQTAGSIDISCLIELYIQTYGTLTIELPKEDIMIVSQFLSESIL